MPAPSGQGVLLVYKLFKEDAALGIGGLTGLAAGWMGADALGLGEGFGAHMMRALCCLTGIAAGAMAGMMAKEYARGENAKAPDTTPALAKEPIVGESQSVARTVPAPPSKVADTTAPTPGNIPAIPAKARQVG